MKKQLFLAGALTLPLVGLAGTAMATSNNGASNQGQMADKLATRFGLNKDEVKAFMNEQRSAKRTEIEARLSESLKAAGFTDTQIAELQAKKQEQRTEYEAWREANPDATKAERQTRREAEKAEFEAWAKEKGIDLETVRSTLHESGMGKGMHRDRRGQMAQ